jgi:MFS family permease
VTTALIDRRPLSIREFRRIWTASLVAAVGGSFAVIAVPAQLFELTGSSAAVGVSSAASFIALLVSSLWSGVLADTMDRRKLLLAAHSTLALTYVLFFLQGAFRSVPLMLLLVVAQGLSFGAIMTTMGAAVPRVVPPGLLTAANSLSSLVRYLGSILGPLLAGVLIPLIGLGPLYLLDAAALLVVVWAVFRLPPIPPAVSTTPAESVIHQLLEGFRYLAAQPVLVAVLGVDLASMLFGMPYSLFPEMAVRAFSAPEDGSPTLGLLYAAYPVGVFAVGLVSGTFTRAQRPGVWLVGASVAWGASVMVFGLAQPLWLGLAALVLGGAVNFVLSTFRNSITQAHTDDALRGRIQGSLTVLLFGGPQMAGVLHGLVSPLIGPRATVFAGGALTVVAAAGIALTVPELIGSRPRPPD